MIQLAYGAAHGLIATVMAILAVAPGTALPPQTAILQSLLEPPATASAAMPDLPPVTPGLLPAAALSVTKTRALPTSPTIKTAAIPKPEAPAKNPAPAAPPVAKTSIALNAQAILDATVLSFKERRDGLYEAILSADLGTGKILRWGMNDTAIGGTNGIPPLATSITCDPGPAIPDLADADQEPVFQVRTQYSCAVSLALTTGNDRVQRTRTIVATTDAGALVVSPPSSMTTLLKNDINEGGFVFDNQDSRPVTVTGVSFDVSFTALVTIDSPLVLRFLADTTDPTRYDLHLENVPESPAGSFIHTENGNTMPVTFTIPAHATKLLPIEALGVHKMTVFGTDPKITVTLRNVTTADPSKLSLASPTITWSCTVPFGSYDPNATSGPFAMGTACRE